MCYRRPNGSEQRIIDGTGLPQGIRGSFRIDGIPSVVAAITGFFERMSTSFRSIKEAVVVPCLIEVVDGSPHRTAAP